MSFVKIFEYQCVCIRQSMLFLIISISFFSSDSMAADSVRMRMHNPVAEEGLTVLGYGSSEFRTELPKLLSSEAISKASPFLPYSVIVINNSGRYIWGFTVVYTYVDWIADGGKPWRRQISPSAGVPERKYMLEPGGAYFISPVSTFYASRLKNGTKTLQPLLDEGMDRIITHFETYEGPHKIEASIDSIIFEDGLIIGPDSAGRMEEVNSRIRLEIKMSASVAGLRGKELRTALERNAQQSADDGAEHYRRTAGNMLNLMDSRGEEATLEALGNLQQVKRFVSSNFIWRNR